MSYSFKADIFVKRCVDLQPVLYFLFEQKLWSPSVWRPKLWSLRLNTSSQVFPSVASTSSPTLVNLLETVSHFDYSEVWPPVALPLCATLTPLTVVSSVINPLRPVLHLVTLIHTILKLVDEMKWLLVMMASDRERRPHGSADSEDWIHKPDTESLTYRFLCVCVGVIRWKYTVLLSQKQTKQTKITTNVWPQCCTFISSLFTTWWTWSTNLSMRAEQRNHCIFLLKSKSWLLFLKLRQIFVVNVTLTCPTNTRTSWLQCTTSIAQL